MTALIFNAAPATADMSLDAGLPLGFKAPAASSASTASVGSTGGGDVSGLIARHARSAGVPLHLAMAVVRVESNYNARARGRAGEIGLMQIKPATARGIGFTGNTSALYDPDTNLRWGMAYLGTAYKLAKGDLCGTILRYNAGHYARSMNPISSRYCGKVKSMISRGDFGAPEKLKKANTQLVSSQGNAGTSGDGAGQFRKRYDPTAL